MKLLVIGDETRTKKYLPDLDIVKQIDLVVAARGSSNDEILALAADADFILADAISPVDTQLIEGMPNLKLIHSEGVAYNLIDVKTAQERNIFVCNNAGVNAGAVAEQAILLMLACLRDLCGGDAAVRAGQQIQTKERMMVEGIRELGDCSVGIIGFGAIGQAIAKRLANWGCAVYYTKRHRLSTKEEAALGVSYLSQEDLVATCDIVNLCVPVTEETRQMVNQDFLACMKEDALLINTARGEVIDQEALAATLESGKLAGVGLDVLSPEPVELDNPLLNLSPKASRRVVLSPHIGGITEGMFRRAHRCVWENIARVVSGETPINQV